MKKIIFFLGVLSLGGISFSQVITPFTVRKTITQKGSILYLSNSSSKAVPDNVVQNEMPPSGTGYDNNFTNGYIDIDADASTFMSSSDQLNLPTCSEISWAGLYWGGACNAVNTNYSVRSQVKLKLNSGSYQTLTADYLKDNSVGYKSYHCFKDITSYINTNGLTDKFTVANVVTDVGGKNLFGGWTIVIVYKNNTMTMRNLTVFEGLANVSSGATTVDIPISGFQTPLSGPVNFEIGLVAYDGDRSLTGDQLMFKGATSFVNIYDALHPVSDVFNSTIARNGVLTTLRIPSYNNTLGYDANIFSPDNSTKNLIGNNAISATIRQTTGGETYLTQVVTSAIDVYEPDLRSAVRVVNLTHPGSTNASPGDTLLYSVNGLNIGSDPAINVFISDTIEGNAFYIPNSITITSGPNAGAKTDASGDDQAEYISASKVVKVRIGTGANGYIGGQVNNSPSGADSTLFTFKVRVSSDCAYMYCDNTINNSAHIVGTGNVSGNTFDNKSNPGVFDANGCAISGSTATPINTSGCSIPSASANSPICQGGTINFTATSSPSATYLWTGPNGFTSTLNNPSITNIQAVNAGTYTCNIFITGTSCHFVYPFVADINIANAGIDQVGATTCGLTTITLAGNIPSGSSGQWTIVSGTGGDFGTGHTSTSTNPTTTFNGIAGNTYLLRWSLTSPGCPTTTDDVTITFSVAPSLASLSGVAATCNNRLNVAITGGVSPYSVTINNGVGTITNYSSGADITVNPASTTTYTLTSVTGANGCSATSLSPSTYQLVVSNAMGTGSITQNNAPTASAFITSPKYPTSSATVAGTNTWSNTANTYSSDNTYSTSGTSSGNTQYLYMGGFGFSIPTNATIDGIIVKVEKHSSGATVNDSRISLATNASTVLGSNKSVTGAWPTTDAISTYGTTTDLWGGTTSTITPAVVNASSFGIRIRPSLTTGATAYVDYATVTVYYHTGTGSSSYCDNATSVSFSISGYSGATSYIWTPPTGATVTSGQGTSTAVMNFNGAGQSGNYSVSVTPSNSCGNGTPTTITIPISDCANSTPYCIKGNVYWDINGSAAPAKVDGTGIGTINGTQMYVSVAKTSGTTTCFATVPVNSDGTWEICNASVTSSTALRVVLSKNNYATGTALASLLASMPTGVSSLGEINNDIGNTLTGNDGTTDGIINFTTVASMTNNETNLNFGLKINTPPVANSNTASTNEDTPVTFNITSNDTDVDGTVNASTVTLSTAISNGTWSVNSSGNVTYTPSSNFNGTASITYTVKDNDNLTSNSATITVTVNPVNDPPNGTASSVTATENSPFIFSASDFHYTDPESDANTAIVISSLPSLGSLSVNGTAAYLGQTINVSDISTIIYIAPQDQSGTPYTTFTFTVNDEGIGSVSGTMTINVTHVPGPPVAVNDNATTNQNTAVNFNILSNDTNADGTLVSSSVDLNPNNAGQQSTLTIPGQGTFTYSGSGIVNFTPESSFYGTTVPITYSVNNSYGYTSNSAEITVTVVPSGAPVAVNDAATTTVNNSVSFSVTNNDTDDGTINPARVDLDPSSNGFQQSLYVNGEGQFSVDLTGEVSFQPDWNFSGVSSITYTVRDNLNLVSNVATITVTVNWANTAPFAIDDFATTSEDTPISFSITSNDYDQDASHGNSGVLNLSSIDLDPYTAGRQTTFTVSNQGTFTVNNSGVVTFTPVLNYYGTVTPIEYTVDDTDPTAPLTSNNGFIYVTVTSVNDAPVAVNDTYTNAMVTSSNASITISILSNDSDVDGTIDVTSVDLDPYTSGQQFSYSVSGQGTYTVNNSGVVTFSYSSITPVGTLTPIYYTINDNDGSVSNNASITVTILAGPPTAVNDAITTYEDTPISYDVTQNDTDINGVFPGIDSTTVTLTGTLNQTGIGVWSITDVVNLPGEVTFTPVANFSGTATMTYTVKDLDGNTSNVATITVTILSVNDAPSFSIGSNQTLCANAGSQTVTGWATAISPGPSDESSQSVSFVVTNNLNSLFSVQPAVDATGKLTYTLAANQSGTCTVSVYAQDNGGTTNGGIDISATQTFTITVSPTAVAGTISGATSVCTGTNSTTLTLSGSTGTRQWQSSTDNVTFTNISGSTGTTYTATNLTTTTYYKVVLTSGTCPTATTTAATITVNPTSVAGTISGATSVCTGTNSTLLTLTGYTGTIQWQSSINNSTFSNITGATSATYTATNLTATTYYKVVVTSGSCASATSASSFTITVNSLSVAGSISGGTNVCSGTNSTLLTLTGNTGTIQWQNSSNNSTFSDIIGSTGSSYTATNLTSTTYYRVVVTNGSCSSTSSFSVTITVNPISVGGTVSGSTSVCTGTNSSSLTLSGNTGSITRWESSPVSDFSSGITTIANTTSTLVASNLSTTTYYRAVVTSGVCSSTNSAIATITVNPLSVAGSITGSSSVCTGTNSTLLTLSGNTGSIQWQSSSNNSTFSNLIGATSSTYTATNLSSTTYYRVLVTSGSCSSSTSASSTITVNSLSVSGTLTGGATVCSGNNSTLISLNGNTGTIQWQNSSDNSAFNNITGATSATYTATNLNLTTYYRVLVANGVCPAASTQSVTIIVNATPNPPNTTSSGHCVYAYPSASVSDANGFSSPTFKWYSASSNGTLLQSSTATTYSNLITATTTYYVSVIHPVSGCESSRSSVTDTVIDPISIFNPVTNDYIWKGGAVGALYDWMTVSNWCQYDGTKYITVNQTPASSDNVIIPPSSRCITAQPIVTGAADQFINIDIKPGGVLTVSGTGVMNVSGNWTNNGTFNCGSGTVYFVGQGTHFINGTNSTTFNNVVINKPPTSGTKGKVKLQIATQIQGTLTLTDGLFDIDIYHIDMDNRTVNGGSISTYVQTSSTGTLKRVVGSTNILFPIGKSSYNPAQLSNTGASDKFAIRVVDNLSANGYNADTDGLLDSSIVKRTWMIDEAVQGGSNVALTLFWNGDEHHKLFDQSIPYIAHYNSTGQKWENKGSTDRTYSATANSNIGAGFVTTTGLSDFSPYGISSPTGGVSLPVEFLYFNTNCIGNNLQIEWATASEHNSDYFAINSSSDGINWREVGKNPAAGNSNEKLIYNYSLLNEIETKYINLFQFDIDSKKTQYGPFLINCNDISDDLIVYPNPARESIFIQFENIENNDFADIVLREINGEQIITKEVNLIHGMNTYKIELDNKLTGVYFIEFSSNNKVYRKKIVIM